MSQSKSAYSLLAALWLVIGAYAWLGTRPQALQWPWGAPVQTGDLAARFLQPQEEGTISRPHVSLAQRQLAAQPLPKPQRIIDSLYPLLTPQRQAEVDTSRKKILLAGDSMAGILYYYLSKYCKASGHQLRTLSLQGTSSIYWAGKDTLSETLAEFDPDLVLFCLGANEITIPRIRAHEKYFKRVLDTLSQRDYLWVGTPVWTPDTNYYAMMQDLVQPEKLFIAPGLQLSRQKDGAHPDFGGARLWTDTLVKWIVYHSAHPVYFRRENRLLAQGNSGPQLKRHKRRHKRGDTVAPVTTPADTFPHYNLPKKKVVDTSQIGLLWSSPSTPQQASLAPLGLIPASLSATIGTHVWDLLKYQPGQSLMFNNGLFLLVFAVFLTVYVLLLPYDRWRKDWLILFSLYFYYKASGYYLWLLVLTVGLDWQVARWLTQIPQKQGRWLLALSIVVNLAFLAYFKYINLLIDSWNQLSQGNIAFATVFLPIGISFFTFQTISYKVDVFKGLYPATASLRDYAFYMCFFPHLVAGPIVRARDFLPQVAQAPRLDVAFRSWGLFMIVKGLFKKAVVADYVAQYADLVFANPAGYSSLENAAAMYAYTLQIFCDFSGYTDMAIGISALLGYQLGENFRSPYKALTLTDFWRRWHISLSSWLRDYLYIPLGGNKKGPIRQQVNQLITMLLGGLWHGAAWRFVTWGGAHGLGLVYHKLLDKLGEQDFRRSTFWTLLGWLATFHWVALLWVFFRAESYERAWELIARLGEGSYSAYLMPFWQTRPLFVVVLLGGFALTLLPENWKEAFRHRFESAPLYAQVLAFVAVMQLGIEMSGEAVQPFIYFQF